MFDDGLDIMWERVFRYAILMKFICHVARQCSSFISGGAISGYRGWVTRGCLTFLLSKGQLHHGISLISLICRYSWPIPKAMTLDRPRQRHPRFLWRYPGANTYDMYVWCSRCEYDACDHWVYAMMQANEDARYDAMQSLSICNDASRWWILCMYIQTKTMMISIMLDSGGATNGSLLAIIATRCKGESLYGHLSLT